MNATIVTAVARHLLTAFGGAALTAQGLDPSSIETGIGAAATIIGILWSVWDKKSRV